MIYIILLSLIFIFITYLIYENYKNDRNRKKIKNIIHVNGIRGKSSVTRLIHAGLKSGGFKVYAKTTGTLPMTINKRNIETEITRKGKANIKEQIKIIEEAIKDNSDILSIECMAVNPRLQYISQNSILKADIGILTNVRLDHTEEMGSTLEEICESLCNFIPINGILITSEEKFYSKIEKECNKKKTKIIKAVTKSEYDDINFPENVACALEVCKLFNIETETALYGMKSFIRDPYDLRLYTLPQGGLFINGLSINDPDSSQLVYERVKAKYNLKGKNLILLINNRPDRGYRAKHMILLAKRLNPEKIIITGSFLNPLKKALKDFDLEVMDNIKELNFQNVDENSVIYAVGNIANNGDIILEEVKKVGKEYVWQSNNYRDIY